jgi:hypothetical protein
VELDDFKQALASLESKLDQQAAVQLAQGRRAARTRLQDHLRPLDRAQNWQIGLGVVTAFIGVAAWHGSLSTMGGLFVSGVILHVYGIAMILLGAITKTLLGTTDWSGPVLDIQRRLAGVRKTQVLGGIVIGLSWCALWVPALIVLAYLLTGSDVTASSPSIWAWLAAGGVALMGVAGLLYGWARASGRTRIITALDQAFTGEQLARAQADLDDIRRFARD